MLNKTVTPNLVAAFLAIVGLVLDGALGNVVLSVGLFALSGALTNWLAIHMLFQRVPGLYGSGVIELHFEELKRGIVDLVRDELFGADKVDRLFAAAASGRPAGTVSGAADATPSEPTGASAEQTDSGSTVRSAQAPTHGPPRDGTPVPPPAAPAFDVGALLDGIDIDGAFDQLLATVAESSFGNLLDMVGGTAALEPLRAPFGDRLRHFLDDAARSPRLQQVIARQLGSDANRERFRQRLEALLEARLAELTPAMVRDLMQRLIRRHLGWLVVWGAVFGGAIGLIAGLLRVLG